MVTVGQAFNVAPLVGAWIEIVSDWRNTDRCYVAPLVGAWIEIKRVPKV